MPRIMSHDRQNSLNQARPTHEQVALRAELLWKARGSPSGRDEEIWLEAERQLFDEARELIVDTPAAAKTEEPEKTRVMGEASRGQEEMLTKKNSGGRKRSSR